MQLQSKRILERVDAFGGKLYLEFGGKLFDDYHASRVLPGFQPDSKMKMLLQLREQAEIVIAINAAHIEMNKRRGDLGITYDLDVMVDTLDDPDKIAADIEKAKAKSDLVIVFVHWGTEDSTVPSADQRSWAQFFADHGVGLVIGSGPHALQPMQTVTGADGNEVPVYYSLGNFLSHQKDPLNMQ